MVQQVLDRTIFYVIAFQLILPSCFIFYVCLYWNSFLSILHIWVWLFAVRGVDGKVFSSRSASNFESHFSPSNDTHIICAENVDLVVVYFSITILHPSNFFFYTFYITSEHIFNPKNNSSIVNLGLSRKRRK